MNKSEKISKAVEDFIKAIAAPHNNFDSQEEQLMAAASYAAGFITAESDVTLNLEHHTEWLQDKFEEGRDDAGLKHEIG